MCHLDFCFCFSCSSSRFLWTSCNFSFKSAKDWGGLENLNILSIFLLRFTSRKISLLDFVILFGGSLWEKEDGRCWWIWRSETDWWCSCRCFWDGTPLLQWNWFLWEMVWRWMKDCHRRQGWIPVSPLSRTSSLQILFLFVVSFLGWVLRVSCPVSEQVMDWQWCWFLVSEKGWDSCWKCSLQLSFSILVKWCSESHLLDLDWKKVLWIGWTHQYNHTTILCPT